MQFRQLMSGILRFRAHQWTMQSWCNRVQWLLMTPYSKRNNALTYAARFHMSTL